MSILKQLQEKNVHPCKAILNPFESVAVGKMLGISGGYLSSVLNGSKIPSVELDQKIRDLAKRVQAEKAENAAKVA